MQSLGTLNGGEGSYAGDVNADGSVVVGVADDGNANNAYRAFRWTEASGMQSLGTLNGGSHSYANGVNADGSVVVGNARDGNANNAYRAFRWTEVTGMQSLGVLNGGNYSYAHGVNADGSVVVGEAGDGNNAGRAFLWTEATGMQSLGTLNGGNYSYATGVNADGSVVVGGALDGDANNADRAFRWTEATGMQSVEQWLSDNGVAVDNSLHTYGAEDVSDDGNTVVGRLDNNHAFIARVSTVGTGLTTLDDANKSLASTVDVTAPALRSASLLINGAHSHPMSRYVDAGKKTVWLAGDWGNDNHNQRDGSIGITEFGAGYNFGKAQVNVSLGKTKAHQNTVVGGKLDADGHYIVAETTIPLSQQKQFFATFGAYQHNGKIDSTRGYLNAGLADSSKGKTHTHTTGVRARLDWQNAMSKGKTKISPYADLNYAKTHMDAYTETGGGFPAHFNARNENTTDLRLGFNAATDLKGGKAKLITNLEGVHRFDKQASAIGGNLVGLFSFEQAGEKYKQNWLKAGVGVEGKLGKGKASVMLNATTEGEMPSTWLAASYQIDF